MDINAEKGHKVRFLEEHGYEFQRHEAIKDGLAKGNVYTVESVDVGSWSSAVVLKEFPGKEYNTVMFEDADVH